MSNTLLQINNGYHFDDLFLFGNLYEFNQSNLKVLLYKTLSLFCFCTF